MLNHLDLFSGIGGFALGLERTGEKYDWRTNWESLAKADKGGRIMRRLASIMLPTPRATDNKDRGGPIDPVIVRRADKGQPIELSMRFNGPLDPRFVEEMMGFPENWTDPD